ncbi:hypothetical protein C7212DRAFT_363066 [Tuber magnatum]|uniref:Uncharacterized protein n=1 Tax=Tuber magnatum TaxID=42249 RepID=A0A317SXC6_9PEZI|nr:hypothetical protein C7212DRAFT_363066 [Tuber magnatum]
MSQRSDTNLQRTLHAQIQSEHEMADGNLTVAETNKYTVSSTVFGSWERFKGRLRGSLPEWSAEAVLGERPGRDILEKIGKEGSLVNTSRGGDTTPAENSGLVAPEPRYPLLRHTSAPSIIGENRLAGPPESLPKANRRAYSFSINGIGSVFPFPSEAARTASPPASMYELTEFLHPDIPLSKNSPETWLPCPRIPKNSPILSHFEETAPRPKIPHVVDVTERPRGSASSFPSERGWWNYFYRGGCGSSHATAQSREEAAARAPEPTLPLTDHDRWSMDVEAANTPHTPLTEKALQKHQKRLRYKARMSKLRVILQRAWG